MPAVHLGSLELAQTHVVIRPLKSDMAVEKKYDRHGFGELIAMRRDSLGGLKAAIGDYVVYDDSKAVEIPLELKKGEPPVTVDVVESYAVCAVDHIVSPKGGK